MSGQDRPLWVEGEPSPQDLDRQLLDPLVTPPPGIRLGLAVTGLGTVALVALVIYTFVTGTGLWGNNIPNAWGFPIICFVWWIGIGHAGTFISAVLLLLEKRWRASVNRFAEAMTLFALVCAGLYPLLHLGRPWFFYWLVPYPSTTGVWPQFRSPLTWDIAAVLTYSLVSLLFWYVGLLPDLASARDRVPSVRRRQVYGLFALGWRGTAHQWRQRRGAMLLMAGVATPLVVSVHSIVSLDFAVAILPGWHSTIFPPYFVVGAIHSGFAMVLVLLIPAVGAYRLHGVVTPRHLNALASLLLTTSLLMAYVYVLEPFLVGLGAGLFERQTVLQFRPFGRYATAYWAMLLLNVGVPQVLWWRRLRQTPRVLWGVGLAVLVGMWLERFVIVIGSLYHDFLPSSWYGYVPSVIDGATFLGTICLFLFLFLCFLRWVPFISLAEVKELAAEGRGA